MLNEDHIPLVLIVDDQPKNLQLAGHTLSEFGFNLHFALNGAEALDLVQKNKPDLILLDIMMPEMDGYELCKKIKLNPETEDIPIIFLTAKTDSASIVKGLKLGAADYISKPFISEELIARVKQQIDVKSYQHALKEKNDALKKANAELESLHMLRNQYLSMVTHELKNPLTAIIGIAQMLDCCWEDMCKEDPQDISKQLNHISNAALNMSEKVTALLKDQQLSSKIDEFDPKDFSPRMLLYELKDINQPSANLKEIEIKTEWDELPQQIRADRPKIKEMVDNLISNAIKYSPPKSVVTIHSQASKIGEQMFWELTIRDEGPGFTKEDKKNIYKQFKTLSAKPTGKESASGLGLFLVRKIVEQHEGTIELTDNKPQGAIFTIKIPTHLNEDVSLK